MHHHTDIHPRVISHIICFPTHTGVHFVFVSSLARYLAIPAGGDYFIAPISRIGRNDSRSFCPVSVPLSKILPTPGRASLIISSMCTLFKYLRYAFKSKNTIIMIILNPNYGCFYIFSLFLNFLFYVFFSFFLYCSPGAVPPGKVAALYQAASQAEFGRLQVATGDVHNAVPSLILCSWPAHIRIHIHIQIISTSSSASVFIFSFIPVSVCSEH